MSREADVNRRTVIKGMAAASALLGLSIPEWSAANSAAGERRRLLVLLGGSNFDDEFASGARATASAAGAGRVTIQRLRGDDIDRVSRLFSERNGTRLVGIMADGAYAVFHELARHAAVDLISLGRHSCSTRLPSRHTILSSSPRHRVGATLARCLSSSGRQFILRETMLDGSRAHVVHGESTSVAGAILPENGGACSDPIADCARSLGEALVCVALDVVPRDVAHGSAISGAQRRCVAATYVTFVMDVG